MKKGFTLIELLVAVLIATLVLGALLLLLNYTFALQETSRNLTAATNAGRQEIERVRSLSFETIIPTGGTQTWTFNLNPPLQGIGQVTASYVTGSNNNLIDLRVVVCWRQRGGRIIGEDNGAGGGIALDGILNGEEDTNGNGEIDSPVVLFTAIRRTQ